MRRLVPCWLAVALAVTTVAAASSATRFGEGGVPIGLGDGMDATPNHSPCGGAICVTWSARGFWTPVTSLPSANMYASAGNGRIVAAFSRSFAYSDDRGRTWHFQALERGPIPMALAVDPASGFGVAVGSGGSIWTSEDRGATWALRRSGGVDNLIEVVVRNRTFAFVSARGGVSVSVDSGTTVRDLVRAPEGLSASVLVRRDAMWVGVPGRWLWRLYDGWIEAADR